MIDAGKFLSLEDEQVISQLLTTDGLIDYIKKLIVEVYEDTDLAEERAILNQETQAGQSQLERLTEIRLRVLLKIRKVIKKALQDSGNKNCAETHQKLKNLVLAMKDGDLAYTTYRWVRDSILELPIMLGDAAYRQFIPDLRFSPELQKHIATADEFESIPLDLVSNLYLTDETQRLLFQHPHPNVAAFLVDNHSANSPEMLKMLFSIKGDRGFGLRIRLAYSDREFPPEVLELINADPMLVLIRESKTDPQAELALIELAKSNQILRNYLRIRTRIHTENALRNLHQLLGASIKVNKNIHKHPQLVDELGLS